MATGTAVVVGGGIGGLSAALALHRAGWPVTVLERAPELHEVGAGLTLMANAMHALDALGVADAVRARGGTEAAGGMRTSTGRWLSRLDAAAMTRLLGTSALAIHRATLHRLLHAALPPGVLRTGAEVVDVTPEPSGAVRVRYRGPDGPADVGADLVVAADGINSTLRSRLWPQAAPPVYSGSTAWRAVIAWDRPVPVAASWGAGAEFGMAPLGDGQVYWYGAVNAPAGQRADDELAAVRQHFGRWHDPIPALLAATGADAVLRNDIYHLGTPLDSYRCGRVVLLGDAAHAMTPNLGQGACQAIEDAVVLGAAVAASADVDAALAAYDRQRRPRTQEIARAAARIGRYGQQLRNPLAIGLRNTALRLTPARMALRSMARYADWRPPVPRVAAR